MHNESDGDSSLKAGFIGLGAMGAPMARHLRARGMLAVGISKAGSPRKASAPS
jgi:3-hydroxyisobutyrate dehydrogenase